MLFWVLQWCLVLRLDRSDSALRAVWVFTLLFLVHVSVWIGSKHANWGLSQCCFVEEIVSHVQVG